eukprot:s2244_g6.t1
MCAAAMPSEPAVGRLNAGVDGATEAQFPMGNGGQQTLWSQRPEHARHSENFAKSFLRSGHFLAVNDELARVKRAKEVNHQLSSGRALQGPPITKSQNTEPRELVGGPRPSKAVTGTATKSSRASTVSAGGDDRDGEGKSRRRDSQKPGMKEAVKLARAPNDLKKAKEAFKKKFLAKGTLLAKNAKRRKVSELLTAILGEEHFPVNQYIHEVKLMHIEAGYEWGAPLERQLFLCKKALKRHRGPEVRAKELQLADISQDVWDEKQIHKGDYIRPAWMYAMAVLWMLGACEVTDLRMGDVEVDFERKVVALKIRKSKTDQSAKGATRTLACCGRQSCSRECPWTTAVQLLSERPNGKANDFLFATNGRVKRDRAHTARCWAKTIDKDLTGHARKTNELQVSGSQRRGGKVLGGEHAQSLERWTEKLTAAAPRTPAPQTPARVAPGTPRPLTIPEDPEAMELWATSWARGRKRVAHFVTRASWQVDLNEWATACGWHFAQRAVKVSLAKEVPPNAQVCLKCEKVRELRDGVTRGAELAQLVTNDLCQLLPSKGERQHGFQIWLNVPKVHKADDPQYGTVKPELLTEFDLTGGAGRARLLAGPYADQEGAFRTKQSVQMIDFEVTPRAAFCHAIPEHMETVLVYCYRGELRVGAEGKKLPAQHVARLDGTTSQRDLLLEAGEDGAACILFAGKRINEPIAWHGPFVASDKKELQKAFRAYQDGSFPPKRVPWDYRRAAAVPKS